MQRLPITLAGQNMTNVICGAHPAEWDAFVALAQPDLLPYLADPSIKMSPGSRVTPGDKTPGYIKPETGLGVGMLAWPSHKASDNNIIEWRADNRLGVCLICREFRAIDIDISDEGKALEVEGAIREFLGTPGLKMPLRTRQGSGKRALLYRIADAPGKLRKWRIPTPDGVVEFLFDKQQTVVAGRHPAGARYEWPEGFPTRENVPTIEMQDLIALIAMVKREFGSEDFDREWGITVLPEIAKGKPQDAPDDPAVKFLLENDLVIDYASDGGIYVRCPWEHEHTGPTKFDAAKYFPAGLNRPDAGFNCFHAHCTGRDHHAFLEQIGYVADEFEVVEAQGKHVESRPRFTYRGSSGIIEASLDNVVKALSWRDGLGIHLVYDKFRDAIIYRTQGSPEWQELTDDSYTAFRLRLTAIGMDATIPKQHVIDAVSYVAKKNAIDSAQEWLGAKRWDGAQRLRHFHTRVLGIEDSPYHRAVVMYLWTALAGRVLEPGVKADMAVVLTGAQGLRKSTLVEVIAPTPAEYAAVTLTERDADLARLLRGKLVAEWDELRGLETRDAEAIKGWMTHRFDEWVPKFKEFGTVRPRRFVLIGTNNRARFLTDPTGSRRFLPLALTQTIDTEYVIANRDQLWAEAAHLFQHGGIRWQDAERLAGSARRGAELLDGWTGAICDWLAEQGTDGHSTAWIANRAVLIPIPAVNRTAQDRIRRVMTYLGWTETPEGRWVSDLA